MRKAVEVVTLLGDSVVDVSYRTSPTRVSRAPRVLAALGLVCLLCSGAAFGAAVVAAATNDSAFDAWTSERRPAFAFRPEPVSPMLDMLAFGGAALGVCFFTAALLQRRRERNGPIEIAGEVVAYDELAVLGGRVDAGPAAYVIRLVESPERTSLQRRSELRPVFYAVGSLAAHAALLWLMSTAPIEGEAAAVSFVTVDPTPVLVETTATEHVTHGAFEHHEDLSLRGPSMVLEELPSYTLSNEHVRMKPAERDPQAERALAIEAAMNAGILGSSIMLSGGAFASLTADFETGFDDYNNIYCTNCRDQNDYGGFGYGRSSFGVCGGEHLGTIGTGRYGTVGWSSRGNAAQPRTHVSSAPTTTAGHPTVAGASERVLIRRYIKRHINKITYCYEKELLARPTLEGVITVQFFIDLKGTVTSAVGTGFDQKVASCVADVIRNIQFRYGDGPAQVNYPFTFRPAGP